MATISSSPRLDDLRVNHLSIPLGLDDPHPCFRWRWRADRPGARQTAYRIHVATDPSLLAVPDAWDSGEVATGVPVRARGQSGHRVRGSDADMACPVSWMANYEEGVEWMRAFARSNGAALADASRTWSRLRDFGIPYETLLTNAINHPNDTGHAIYAETLAKLLGGVIGPGVTHEIVFYR